ncbi:uncharacterized protein [Paralichthys olivaceus]|uniref:uncharacterized protein n=1 Tax=Paralichthys olivaceus TaxID=8255 RepID=UPI0037537CA6
MKQQNVVQKKLLSPEDEIKALKEELKKKDGLIQRETKKRRARTNAYMDCLGSLTALEKKLKSCEAKCDALKASQLLELTQVEETWGKKVEVLQERNTAQKEKKQKNCEAQCDALKASHLLELNQVKEILGKKVEVLQDEIASLKETSNSLTSENTKLKDKARQKDAFMRSLRKQKNADSDAYLSSVCSLTALEKKLKSCEAQCDALKASHLLELTQVEETWGKTVEVVQMENAALKETTNSLTSENTKLKDKVRQKDAFMQSLSKQKNADRNAFLSSVCALIVKEKERKSCEAECEALKASHLLELTQVQETWGKKVEVLQERNAALKEKEQKSCEAQYDALKASHLLELTQVEETWGKTVEVLQMENAALKETTTSLTSENTKLKDKARQKDAFMRSLWKQNNADSNAYLSSVCSLTALEKKLKSCEAQCDALKASHLLELTQVEETWGKKVEVLQERNAALKEKEQKSCEAECEALKASHLLELTQVEETWGKKVEVLQERNAALKEKEQKSCEAQYDALKASHLLELTQVEETWGKTVEVLQMENAALKETTTSLTSENTKLKDKARQKDAFMRSLWKQNNADSNAYLSSVCSLTALEKKLKSCEAQCDALKASHLLELTQVEETWGKTVEVVQMENAALKETTNSLTSENTKLKDKVRQKDAFMRSLWKQRNADSNAFLSSVCALIVKEKERKSCEAECEALKASHLLELTQVEETWGKKVEVLQERNAAQKEKELKSFEAQCDTLKASHLLELTQVEETWRKKVKVLRERNAAQKEKEKKSCEAQCNALKASHLLKLTQVKETWGKKVEVLQERNAAQKEKEKKSCEAQCAALKANHLLELTQVEDSWMKKVEDVTAEVVALEELVTLLNKKQPELTQKDSEPQLKMETVKGEDKPEVTESKPHEEKKNKRRKKWWRKLLKH